MTVQTALLQGTRLLEDAGIIVPRLTAEVLLSTAMRCERVYLFAHPEQELKQVEWLHYGRYLHERMQGKPTQYITRRQEFYGREFRVTRSSVKNIFGNGVWHISRRSKNGGGSACQGRTVRKSA